MKLVKRYLAFMAVFSLIFTSCTKDEEGTLNNDQGSESFAELSLGATLNDFVNRAAVKQSIPDCSSEDPAFAHIELTHNSGTDLEGVINVNVPILNDNGSFYTDYDEDLKIPVANADDKTATVSVTTFLVYDGDPDDAGSTVIWAAPATTSDYGAFVNQGLPYNFAIRAGSKKYVDIEVLCFDDRDVNLYGYQFFDLVPEVLHEVCIFANYCDDDGRHYTANYSLEVIYTGGDEDRTLYTSMDLPEDSYGFDEATGDYYADPFCFAVPAPMFEETTTTDYIRIIATLSNWEGNYPTPAEEEIVLNLSWSDLMESVREDGTIDYFHILFCDDDDDPGNGNGNGEECDPEDATADCDNDGIINGEDECPNTAPEVDVDENGCEIIGDDCEFNVSIDCTTYYLNGSSDLVTVDQSAFYLAPLGGEFDDRVATITLGYAENGDIFYFINMTEGYTLQDYQILLYSDESNSDELCDSDSGVNGTNELAAEGSFADPDGYSDTFYAKLITNVCD